MTRTFRLAATAAIASLLAAPVMAQTTPDSATDSQNAGNAGTPATPLAAPKSNYLARGENTGVGSVIGSFDGNAVIAKDDAPLGTVASSETAADGDHLVLIDLNADLAAQLGRDSIIVKIPPQSMAGDTLQLEWSKAGFIQAVRNQT